MREIKTFRSSLAAAPCALLFAAAAALAQEKPAPVPAVPPVPPVAVFELEKPLAIDTDQMKALARDMARLGQEVKIAAGEHHVHLKALAEQAAVIRVDHGDTARQIARLEAQADRARERAVTIKRGGCGDGTIETPEEADSAYECGRRALDRAAWDDALKSFSSVAASKKGPRAVGAYYWRAYAQNRLGQRAEALATLGELKSAYPSSGWAAEANALEVEIRQSSGQRVAAEGGPDEDMKLLALAGLASSDAESAVPMIENVLKSAQSPRVKERALFVLAQSNKPAARDVVIRVARGGGNPDLQLKAVQYVGMFRNAEGVKTLGEIYGTSSDPAVRRAILRSYMMAGAREPLVAAARQEQTPELRLEAVRQLGNMKAGGELADLYARESSAEVKKQILRGLAIAGQSERLAALAQSEPDADLRRTAIRSLGLNRDASTGTILTQMYAKEQSAEVKDAVLDALYTQSNAAALVSLARQEKDPAVKLTIVRRLSTMTRIPEAKEYMLELLR